MNIENGNHLDQELAQLETTAAAFAKHFIPDAKVRRDYLEQTRKFSFELKDKVAKNQLNLQMAARQASSMRNTILEGQRGKSSALGLSIAQFLKKEGKSFSELESKYATQFFNKDFNHLNINQRNEVWREIVKKSGEPRVSASNGAKWMGLAGRGLFVLTIVISIYHIAVAEDKVRATVNEGVAIGGGVAGATALGAAGLFCGTAAIACVPVGCWWCFRCAWC